MIAVITHELDGNVIASISDFYAEYRHKVMHPAEGFGDNLDALWDHLTSAPRDTRYIWKNHLKSRVRMGSDFEEIVKLIRQANDYINRNAELILD